jgi:predicted unusual protein kinase regulating ubiquinone biosynthesis (AarF/ABC1/UbiB family)
MDERQAAEPHEGHVTGDQGYGEHWSWRSHSDRQIGTNILRLCLQELFHFRFMQTDPNWANFLYDQPANKIQLIDFGASREYTKEFMDGWFRLLKAALDGDRGAMKTESEALGYLTGEENDVSGGKVCTR